MFAEDVSEFFDVATGFAASATLAGVAVSVIVDDITVDQFEGGVVTRVPSVLISASQAASAAAGQALVIGAATYTVRSVEREAPDGALVRLVLAAA